MLPHTTSRLLASPSSFWSGDSSAVVVAGVVTPGAQVGDQTVVDVGLANEIVDGGERQQQADEHEQRGLDQAHLAHCTGASSGEVWWRTNSPCTNSVASSRRRSRATAASGSGHRMYHASSHVLVTEIASSAQPEAATQS